MVRRILYFITAFTMLACTEPIDTTPAEVYYPMEDGLYWEYAVSEKQYSLTEEPKTTSYFLKEKLVALEVNNYKIEQYTRSSTAESWALKSISSLSKSGSQIIKNEAGAPTIILYSPISNGDEWNKNSLNNKTNISLKAAKKGEPFANYSKTIQIIEELDSSLIDKTAIYEVYADGLGLVYKENTEIEFCQSSAECIGSGAIGSGASSVLSLVSSGKE